MPFIDEPGSTEPADTRRLYGSTASSPPGLQGPVGSTETPGLNAFRKFLTAMARDVPKESRKLSQTRAAIRRVHR